jgi:hypothetical protein
MGWEANPNSKVMKLARDKGVERVVMVSFSCNVADIDEHGNRLSPAVSLRFIYGTLHVALLIECGNGQFVA